MEGLYGTDPTFLKNDIEEKDFFEVSTNFSSKGIKSSLKNPKLQKISTESSKNPPFSQISNLETNHTHLIKNENSSQSFIISSTTNKNQFQNQFISIYYNTNLTELTEPIDLGLDCSTSTDESLQSLWCESLLSCQISNLNEPVSPKRFKKMKFIANLIKEMMILDGFYSYRQVAFAIIQDISKPDDNEKEKFIKNVFRRVYDAINVLIAAKIIYKKGFKYIWRYSPCEKLEDIRTEIEKKRKIIEIKRLVLKDMTEKYLAVSQLLLRNRNRVDIEKIKIPFIVVASQECPDNLIKIDANFRHNQLSARFRKPIKVLGDLGVVARLGLNVYYNELPEEIIDLIAPIN